MTDREIELKLEGDAVALARLARLRSRAGLTRTKASTTSLRSVYFDTEDFALMAHGFALRVRHAGRTRIQTLKTPRRNGGPLSDRGEWEHVLATGKDRPDINYLPPALCSQIARLANTADIEPRFASVIRRSTSSLLTDDGSEIEFVIDRGAIEAGERTSPVHEIELELKHGTRADLYRVALQLADIAPLRIAIRSKSERGRALARNENAVAARAPTLHITSGATLEDAYAIVLNHCLAHLLANQAGAIEEAAPEALHQMRVALRRLRSALLIFGRVIDGEVEEEFMREAKWLTRAIGRARDYDVFVSGLVAMASEDVDSIKPDKPMQTLIRLAAKHRDEAWAEARAVLAGPRATRFILRLALYLETQGWRADATPVRLAALEKPVAKFAAEALDRRLKSVTKLGHDIDALDISDRHELRKRLKKLRYTASFFTGLYAAATTKSYLRRLSDLQSIFGSLNDLETAQYIVNELSGHGRRFAAPGALLLQRYETQVAKDWDVALNMWSAFRDEPLFWH